MRINGAPAAAPELARLEQTYGIKVAPNDYWYDARSGLGGVMGGPAQAYAPGFDFGSVPRDASSGTTGVLYNGRELPMSEARFVAALFDIAPEYIPQFAGEYVLDANGDLYRAADGAYLGNLVSLAQQKGLVGGGGGSGAGGGDNFWSSGGASGNSAGGRSYISLPGGDSVTSGCG